MTIIEKRIFEKFMVYLFIRYEYGWKGLCVINSVIIRCKVVLFIVSKSIVYKRRIDFMIFFSFEFKGIKVNILKKICRNELWNRMEVYILYIVNKK